MPKNGILLYSLKFFRTQNNRKGVHTTSCETTGFKTRWTISPNVLKRNCMFVQRKVLKDMFTIFSMSGGTVWGLQFFSFGLSIFSKCRKMTVHYFWNEIYSYHLLAFKGTIFQTPLNQMFLGVFNHTCDKVWGRTWGKCRWNKWSPNGSLESLGGWSWEVGLAFRILPALTPDSHCSTGQGSPCWTGAFALAGLDLSTTPIHSLFRRILALDSNVTPSHCILRRANCFPGDDRFIAFQGEGSINFN